MYQIFFIFLKNLNTALSSKSASSEVRLNINQNLGLLEVSVPNNDGIEELVKLLNIEMKASSKDISFTYQLFNVEDDQQEFSLQILINDLLQFLRFFSFSTVVSIDNEHIIDIKKANSVWRKDPSETSQEECENLYSDLFIKTDTPPPWTFIKTYEPIETEGIIYFNKYNMYDSFYPVPKLNLLVEQAPIENKHLFDLLPEFIKNAPGIIEIKGMTYEEVSSLSNSKKIQQLAEAIVFNIAVSIRRLNKKHREHYEAMWPTMSYFVKKGCLQSKTFDHVVRPHILYRTYANKFFTMDEYVEKFPLEGAETSVVPYYDWQCMNKYNLAFAASIGLDPICLESPIDHPFLQHDEFEFHRERKPVLFLNIEALYIEQYPDSKKDIPSFGLFIADYFKKKLGVSKEFMTSEFKIVFKELDKLAPPMTLVIEEESRRFYYESIMTAPQTKLPIQANLVVNLHSEELKNLDKLPGPHRSERLELFFVRATEHLWRDLRPAMISSS